MRSLAAVHTRLNSRVSSTISVREVSARMELPELACRGENERAEIPELTPHRLGKSSRVSRLFRLKFVAFRLRHLDLLVVSEKAPCSLG
jgi:hypothetical protein